MASPLGLLRRGGAPPASRVVTLCGVGAFLGVLAGGLLAARRLAGGELVYPLDDAYIHLAMARTWATSLDWGLAPGSFAPASSSPVWVLLLGVLYRLTSLLEALPLLLNTLAGVGAVWLAARGLSTTGLGPLTRGALVVAMILATPLPFLTLAGMETVPQIFLVSAFTLALDEVLAGEGRAGRLLAVAVALGAIRYESLFILLVAGLLLAARGRLRLAAGLVLAGSLPALLYAAWSVSRGGFALPNSILVRTLHMRPPIETFADVLSLAIPVIQERILPVPALIGHLVVAIVLLALSRLRPRSREERTPFTALLLFAGSTLLHFQLSWPGGPMRYEAYLVWLALWSTVPLLLLRLPRAASEGWRRALAAALVLAATTAPFLPRIWQGARFLVLTPRDIARQQLQMARFFERHYAGSTVALNDIGLVGLRSGVAVVDVFGLADMEVARLRLHRAYDRDALARVVRQRGVTAVAIYVSWFESLTGIPPEWVEAGRWTIPDNLICGDATVVFYGPTAATAERLAAALRSFDPELPATVVRQLRPGLAAEGVRGNP